MHELARTRQHLTYACSKAGCAVLCASLFACDPSSFDRFRVHADASLPHTSSLDASPEPDAMLSATGTATGASSMAMAMDAGARPIPPARADASVDSGNTAPRIDAGPAAISDSGTDANRPPSQDAATDSGAAPAMDAAMDAGSRDASDSAAAADASKPAPPVDKCGHVLPADPTQSGIIDTSVMQPAAIAQHPAVMARGPAVTARFGDRVLWVFGGTSSTTDRPKLSTTSTFSTAQNPLQLDEAQPGANAPTVLLPDLSQDTAQLQGAETLAYEIGALVTVAEHEAVLVYTVYAATYELRLLATRVAHIYVDASGSHAPPRAEPVPEPVFSASGPVFRDGVLGQDGNLYLYSCPQKMDTQFECRIARTPLASVATGSAYRFWNGSSWSADVATAVPVLTEASSRISVSYNPYLRSYLSVHFVWILNQIRIETAPKPEGPWTKLGDITVPQNPVTDQLAFQVDAIEHPELAKSCSKQLLLSYFTPTSAKTASGVRIFEIRPITLELK